MRKIKVTLLVVAMLMSVSALFAQKTITIKGSVRFPANEGKITITESQGFDVIVHASEPINDNGTYNISFKVESPGVYTLDCQKHERVSFWAEDEDLQINLRGIDTAKMRMIGPTYAHIIGGPNNDFMNMVNWAGYRNYWSGAAVSSVPYKIEGWDDDARKQKISGELFTEMGKDYFQRIAHIARYYGNVNSVLSVLSGVKRADEALYNEIIEDFQTNKPNYAPFVKYQKAIADKKAQEERLAPGKPAPEFSYPTADGKKSYGPKDFKGKYLIIDFWASWCGPCRKEVPELKKTYEEFKSQGVEILAVSIDKDKAAWMKALVEEDMPWTQVQAQDAGKEVMGLYQFSGIPHIVVIDKDGNLVGTGYRGAALREKLNELLKGVNTSAPKKESVSMPAMGM